MMFKGIIISLVLLATVSTTSDAAVLPLNERRTLNLKEWSVWIDKDAKWQNDELYLPGEEDFSRMPINAPSCGWDKLVEAADKKCTVPATIEELYSGGNQKWTFKGVCWYVREVGIPKDWEGKTVRIAFEQTRQRAELYVNGKLCGYDLVAETPWTADITEHIKVGEKNQIAIRITNASGGGRGWEDYVIMKWGKYKVPHSNDFTGIGGRVSLITTDKTFIKDVFVKNLLPAKSRNIEVTITLNKETDRTTKGTIKIIEDGKKKALITEKIKIEKGSKTYSVKMTVEKAKLWDIDTPVIYNCVVLLDGKDAKDDYIQAFGFRTVELTDRGNGGNFYINGKRVRFRSAIDWGMYRGGGMYASAEQAKRSIANVKAIGHNALNFHRKIGLPRVMEEADRQGVYLYEEPGGFHTRDKKPGIEQSEFAVKLMLEKVRRMMIRNRNHPSIVTVCLANEDDDFSPSRVKALKMANELNDSVFIYNSSGWIAEPHYRPYSSELRHDYYDEHTVKCDGRFRDDQELSYWQHRKHKQMPEDKMKELPFYWGEVRCYTGPANYWLLHEQASKEKINSLGYDYNLNKTLHAKLTKAFKEWNLAETGSKNIKSPADISRQMGRGLMYINGRLSQKIMVNDYEDGYAINGWSQGPRMPDSWMSAICDEGRNLKGPAEDYAYWCRPLQVAIIRQRNGHLGKPAGFLIVIINEGILDAGDYKLELHVTDGAGKKTDFTKTVDVKIEGGDVYAQEIFKNLEIPMNESWHAGFITLHGALKDSRGKVVADGADQVLLKNRASYKSKLSKLNGGVVGWPEAIKALEDAGATTGSINRQKDLNYVVAGPSEYVTVEGRGKDKKVTRTPNTALTPETMKNVIKAAERGATAIINFDAGWAKFLHEKEILSEPVTQWGGKQHGDWKGSGWGYIDHYLGDQIISSKTTWSTKIWGMPEDPKGFYPFSSKHKLKAYGAYIHEHNDLLALIGEIEYGKGKIILHPGYAVDNNNAFNDLLFFNMVLER